MSVATPCLRAIIAKLGLGRAIVRHGNRGLRVTKIQQYRALDWAIVGAQQAGDAQSDE